MNTRTRETERHPGRLILPTGERGWLLEQGRSCERLARLRIQMSELLG